MNVQTSVRAGEKATFVILAGGASSRMGLEKANLPLMGKPLIQRIMQRGREITRNVLVITNHPQAFGYLGVPLAGDILDPQGPLVGLHTALRTAQTPYVILVGCDMPMIHPALLTYQLDLLDCEDVDAVLPEHSHGLEPLHAVYRRENCVSPVEAALAQGERSLTGWLDRVRVRVVPEDVLRSFDPELQAFINLNTIQEYRAIQGVIRSAEKIQE